MKPNNEIIEEGANIEFVVDGSIVVLRNATTYKICTKEYYESHKKDLTEMRYIPVNRRG